MSDFNVGDKVRVISNRGRVESYFDTIPCSGTVRSVGSDGLLSVEAEGKSQWVDPDILEMVDYTPKDIKDTPDGGPAEYYDFPEGAVTLNDLIEFKQMDFHRGNIFKACWRWGEKAEVTKEYDARKIIYSGARLLKQLMGVSELRKTLQKMLDDPQFKEKDT